jgi:hypothetical protein
LQHLSGHELYTCDCYPARGDALTAIGVQYQLARIVSGLYEGVYMYSVMRWVVFRDVPRGLRSFRQVDSPE